MRTHYLSLRRVRRTAAALGAVCWMASALGFAQEAPAEPASAEPAEAAPAEPATPPPAPTKAAADKQAEAADTPTLGGADADLYGISNDAVPPGSRLDWAERRDIRVVQKRAVVKEGRHGFSLVGGVVPNDDFWTYVAGGLGYNYYFSEDLALSVHGAYSYGVQSSLRQKLEGTRDEGGYGLEVRLPQTLLGYASVGVDWNLLHGKIRFFSTRLVEFDLALCMGIGAVMTKVTTQQSGEADAKVRPDAAGNLGGYVQFYLTDQLAFRLDVHQLFFPAFNDKSGDATGGLSHPLATTLALTWFTSAPQ